MSAAGKHTPGPWAVEYDNADDRSGGQWYEAGPARVWFPYRSTEEEQEVAHANARLIAAAPEMLETLKRIPLGQLSPTPKAAVLAAIAKAEGRS